MTVGLVRAHHVQVLKLRAQLTHHVGRAWQLLGGPDDEDQARFVARAVPLVHGAQRHAAVLMAAYLGATIASSGRGRPVFVSADQVIARARNGATSADVYARPTITMRAKLGGGASYDEALRMAGVRAESAASTDVMLANREAAVQGFDAVAAETGERVVGYRRVLTGASCAFCAAASTRRYRSEDLMPLHDHCDCDVAPIIGDRDPGNVINRDVLAELKGRGPEYWKSKGFVGDDGKPIDPAAAVENDDVPVGVAEHGELGPVLVDPADQFTGPDDL